MGTVVITGGSNGLGKAIALELLKHGNHVIAVGSSNKNGELLLDEATKCGYLHEIQYLQKNLSLASENIVLVEDLKNRLDSLDGLILCAEKHNKEYKETEEGIEASFALSYLSRYILSYGLKSLLEKGENPFIVNICGSGMKGEPNWDDLQHKKTFDPQKVMTHGSRLNDLLGVYFAESDTSKKIKYIMYNPWAVRTPGMKEFFNNRIMDIIYKVIGKTPEQAAQIVMEVIKLSGQQNFIAYREKKALDLSSPSYDKKNAQRLYRITKELDIIKNVNFNE